MLELVDRLLELAVEDHAVGDHDDLVEDGLVVGPVERHEAVGEPGDGVALARARRVLNEVRAAGSLGAGGRLQPANGVPLVVTGEDGRARLELRRVRRPLARHDVDEAAQEVEPRIPRPDLLPQVAGPVAGRVGGVALPVRVATVERQEPRLQPLEPGRHLDEVRVHGEVDECPTPEGHVRGVPILPVLLLRMLDGLVGDRVLQFRRGDRDAVHEQAQVERLRGPGLVRELAGDGQAVGEVLGGQLGRQAVGGLEEREADLDPVVVDTMAEDVHRAPLVELSGEAVAELLEDAVRPVVNFEEALPGYRLGLGDEGEQLRRVEAQLRVEVARPLGLRAPLADPVSAGLDERRRDGVFEAALVGLHAATPAMSCWPVTAAVMRAWRRSMRRSIERRSRSPIARSVVCAALAASVIACWVSIGGRGIR